METSENNPTSDYSPFDNIPDEVLEFIFSLLPPYKDLKNCMHVNKKWNFCAQNVLRKSEINLYKAINEGNVNWQTYEFSDTVPPITGRYYHAACIYEDSMYVFGGCTTKSTTFNDLWRLDLSTRKWTRVLAMGTYPPPKAYSTLIPYEDNLILFGGQANTSTFSLHEFIPFSDVHFYNVTSNRWIFMKPVGIQPPLMGGHSAIIRGKTMIVCGGTYAVSVNHQPLGCEIWVLDLEQMKWTNQLTCDVTKPAARCRHSMVSLDDDHIMIFGGRKNKIFNDCWILNMTGRIWTWREVTINNKEWSNKHIWCNPTCKVGDRVISLSYEQKGSICPFMQAARVPKANNRLDENSFIHRLQNNMRRLIDKDNNVNGKRGMLPHQRQACTAHGSNNNNDNRSSQDDTLRAGPSSVNFNTNSIANRLSSTDNNVDKSLPRLHDFSVKSKENGSNDIANHNVHLGSKPSIRFGPSDRSRSGNIRISRHIRDANVIRMAAFTTQSPSISNNDNIRMHQYVPINQDRQRVISNALDIKPLVNKVRRNDLLLHVLDISTVLEDNTVSWLRPQIQEAESVPEVILYSLVCGRGEIIMFGGLFHSGDPTSKSKLKYSPRYSNSLHYIFPPRSVI